MNEHGVFRRISAEKTKVDQTHARQDEAGPFTVYSNQVKSPYFGETKPMDWGSVPHNNCSKVMTCAEEENQKTHLSAAQRPVHYNNPP